MRVITVHADQGHVHKRHWEGPDQRCRLSILKLANMLLGLRLSVTSLTRWLTLGDHAGAWFEDVADVCILEECRVVHIFGRSWNHCWKRSDLESVTGVVGVSPLRTGVITTFRNPLRSLYWTCRYGMYDDRIRGESCHPASSFPLNSSSSPASAL